MILYQDFQDSVYFLINHFLQRSEQHPLSIPVRSYSILSITGMLTYMKDYVLQEEHIFISKISVSDFDLTFNSVFHNNPISTTPAGILIFHTLLPNVPAIVVQSPDSR